MRDLSEFPAVAEAVRIFNGDAVLVGGCVRDLVMGRQPSDFDLASPLPPDEIEARIRAAGRRAYGIGKRFGTVGFRIGGHVVEVTTYRTEVYEEGSRKPVVDFVPDLTTDLSRRDFTCNAMALHLPGGRVADPFGGREDIAASILRCVGKPPMRFREDPLRLLRAARFAAQLGFAVEVETARSATKLAHKILSVSKERWGLELDKLLVAAEVGAGLRFLAQTRLLNYMLPELAIQVGYDQHSPYHGLDLWEHTIRVVEGVPAEADLRWAALLHDIGKPYTRTEKVDRSNYVHHELVGAEIVDKIAGYLRWSKDRAGYVREAVAKHLEEGSPLAEADRDAKGT